VNECHECDWPPPPDKGALQECNKQDERRTGARDDRSPCKVTIQARFTSQCETQLHTYPMLTVLTLVYCSEARVDVSQHTAGTRFIVAVWSLSRAPKSIGRPFNQAKFSSGVRPNVENDTCPRDRIALRCRGRRRHRVTALQGGKSSFACLSSNIRDFNDNRCRVFVGRTKRLDENRWKVLQNMERHVHQWRGFGVFPAGCGGQRGGASQLLDGLGLCGGACACACACAWGQPGRMKAHSAYMLCQN
jgi:hypothetical protein